MRMASQIDRVVFAVKRLVVGRGAGRHSRTTEGASAITRAPCAISPDMPTLKGLLLEDERAELETLLEEIDRFSRTFANASGRQV
jgi:hypothetical protein